MGQVKHAEIPAQGVTETSKESAIDKPPGWRRLAPVLSQSSHALPYLAFGLFTLLAILTPRILTEEPNHMGAFNLCALFGTDRCGSWLWSGWMYVLGLLAFVLFLRENRRRRNA